MPAQTPAQLLTGFAEYSSWLSRQPDAGLAAERARLEQLPASADRTLRLALLHGLRTYAEYDPKLASSLLLDIAISETQGSAYGQLAQILFTNQPDPRACIDAERLSTLSTGLANQLQGVQVRSHELESQLEQTRKELETERTERTRLESQLKALKSLEAQIKGRDQAGGSY